MYRKFIKRLLDLIFAIILLIPGVFFMLFAVIAIKLMDSSGPLLFKQQRPGKDDKIFTVLKFRTMKVRSQHNGKLLSDHERMTKIGLLLRKSSIDELPQLFNIIKGDMSFIGPRPLLIQYLDHYSEEQRRRHDVKPGISGWAQVNGRNTISWEEKFRYDVWYVENLSFLLDLKIVFLTVVNVLNRKDINISSNQTMPIFEGKANER